MKFCRIFLFALSLFCITSSFAQLDSLQVTTELGYYQSSDDNIQLQHIFSNRRGLIRDAQNDFYFLLGGKSAYRFGKKWKVEVGASFSANSTEIFPYEYYGDISFGDIHFIAGARNHTLGLVNENLNSNSFGLSNNARPFPLLNITIPDYTPLKFTKDFLAVKGNFSHGWLESDRFTRNPFVHTKSFYLKAGKGKVKVYGGAAHFAIWGGENDPFGDLDSDFESFLEVVLVQEATDENNVEQINQLGSHIGILEGGVEVELKNYDLTFNYQRPIEDGSGLIPRNFRDELISLELKAKDKRGYIKEIIVEYIDSRFQSGAGTPDPTPSNPDNLGLFRFGGRDDYHNNFLYQNGWSFHGFSLGNSLFTSIDRGSNFFQPEGFEVFFVNNRVQGVHVGLLGNLNDRIRYKFLATYTQNLGTYAGAFGGRFTLNSPDPDPDYFFTPGLDQFYFLLEASTELPWLEGLELEAGLGIDVGQIYDAVGGIIALKWNGNIALNKEKSSSN